MTGDEHMKIAVVIVELSPGMHKAHCPALPGCLVVGRSRQEALGRISNAVSGYLASFDATVPEQLDLEILERGQGLRGAIRDGNQATLPPRPRTFSWK
jgi:predicted RNase H-like HicB family nuclease